MFFFKLYTSIRPDFRKTVSTRLDLAEETIQEYRLDRLSEQNGLNNNPNESDEYVEEIRANENSTDLQTDQVSYYQTYVTPGDPAVQQLATGKSYEQIYAEAVSWVWVSDETMHGVEEQWNYPNFLLTKSADLATNPVGQTASDCESQAYTLVSGLRAAGMSATDVRVVTGKVNFGGQSGGHARVEVFEDGNWFQLEATSGSYYDSDSKQLIASDGAPYDYFKKYSYPSVEIWTYFNDQYFYDNNRSEGNAPSEWLTDETEEKQVPSDQIYYQIPEELRAKRNVIKDYIQSYPIEDVSTDSIRTQVLFTLNTAEEMVDEGLTAEEKSELTNIIYNSVATARELVEKNENLSEQQKAEINVILDEIESLASKGLTPLQAAALNAKLLAVINEVESSIENETIQNEIQNRRR